MQTTLEKTLEDNLIDQLVHGKGAVSQWTYRPDLKTEADLWDNFFTKLEHRNLDKLNDVMLTAMEKRQIQNQLNFTSFYDAAKWLAGENGVARVEVQREDADYGKVRLVVFNRAEIAGGGSSYEVANQIQVARHIGMDSDSRFDVTLLINGLPMIQIELKSKAHAYMDAFRQIKKYLRQDKFTSIFSMIQMFVVTNGSDTRYIASASDDKLNEQFLSGWCGIDNTPVNDYLEFAQNVLSIPQAHKMIAQYTVLDSKKKALILLRPYQIHAIEAVRNASRYQKSGYVWHTTGSGKTLTAYKVATNLLDIPSINKTIFIVDRVDLDQQTTSSFTAYSENDMRDVDDTDNVNGLINKLLGEDRNVVITTIQKLNHLMKRYSENPTNRKLSKIRELKLAFVVDECHRAVSAAKQQELQGFFRDSLWYGFTGTPIFAENAKQVNGDLARTTQEQYGEVLHQYTVKEAIHDKAVLGFQVEYKSTFSEEELTMALKDHPKFKNDLSLIEKEALIPKETFLEEEHMWKVVDAIVNKAETKLGLNLGSGNTFEGILTTTSIAQAQRYYEMFQAVAAGMAPVKVKERIKRMLPDFPKVAITYSVGVSENDDDTPVNLDKLKSALTDYNQMFDTHFALDSIKNYNSNLNDRLARKSSRYLSRQNQLDLVIVVDRLLTGFDAPCMSTLFIDRPPMQPHNLIQAFSRTNRLFSAEKNNGRIVTFQMPTTFAEAVQNAFLLYSNGGETSVLAPTFTEAEVTLKEKIANLNSLASRPEDIDAMTLPEKKMFAKAFQELDRAMNDIAVYSDFADKDFTRDYGLKTDSLEDFKGKYENVIEEIKLADPDPESEEFKFNIEYELSSFKTDEINYQYILSLLQNFVPQTDELFTEQQMSSKDEAEIKHYIDELASTNPQKANLIKQIWQTLIDNPNAYAGKHLSVIFEELKQAQIDQIAHQLAVEFKLEEEQVKYVLSNFRDNVESKDQYGMADLIDRNSDFEAYKAANEAVKKLKYRMSIRKNMEQVWKDEIQPIVKE